MNMLSDISAERKIQQNKSNKKKSKLKQVKKGCKDHIIADELNLRRCNDFDIFPENQNQNNNTISNAFMVENVVICKFYYEATCFTFI